MSNRGLLVCAALAGAVLGVSAAFSGTGTEVSEDVARGDARRGAEWYTALAQETEPMPAMEVTITVDASKPAGVLKPIWRWCGYDEPNYTYAANGKKLIGQFTGEKTAFGPAFFRAHSLLCTGDGTPHLKWGSTNAYTEDAQGNPVYDWKIVDKIFDTYIDAGAKPYAQISFMPKALSLRPNPYEHNWKPGQPYGRIYTGWTTPPNNYDKWRELNFQWAKHCVEKYGMKEVESWYWEVWNEPNIDYLSPASGRTPTPVGRRGGGTTTAGAGGGGGGGGAASQTQPQVTAQMIAQEKMEDYQKIWDYAADGIRKAIPNAIIGGAETAGDGGPFQRSFIEHCLSGTNYATGQKGSPLGLVSFHAKGAPVANVGHVRMGVQAQLATVNAGFRIVAARPETSKLPVVIGESDPDGCAACQSYNGLYPEYGYRNGSIFAAYTIEQLVRTMDLAQRNNTNLLGAVTWAFEFEDQPIFGGFRALATDGVELPVLNTFRMLNKMGANRVEVVSSGDLGLDTIIAPLNRGGGVRGKADVHAVASRDDRRITIIAWNYHDDDVPGPVAAIDMSVAGIPAEVKKVTMNRWQVDQTHSNAHTAWKAMGSPETPNAAQHAALEDAAKLALMGPAADVAVTEGKTALKLEVPRQGVTLIELSW